MMMGGGGGMHMMFMGGGGRDKRRPSLAMYRRLLRFVRPYRINLVLAGDCVDDGFAQKLTEATAQAMHGHAQGVWRHA